MINGKLHIFGGATTSNAISRDHFIFEGIAANPAWTRTEMKKYFSTAVNVFVYTKEMEGYDP